MHGEKMLISFISKIYSFGDFRVYAEDTIFKTASGGLSTYPALTITKWKGTKSSQNRRATEKDFFIIQVPIRRLQHLIRGVEVTKTL